MNEASGRLIIGVVGNDIHVVANVLLARGLRQAGYEVCNLGVSNRPEHFIDAAIEHEADAILFSSINGEGLMWLSNVRNQLNAVGYPSTLLYVGGNLTIGNQISDCVEAEFVKIGFNRAYHQPKSLDVLLTDLHQDLLNRA